MKNSRTASMSAMAAMALMAAAGGMMPPMAAATQANGTTTFQSIQNGASQPIRGHRAPAHNPLSVALLGGMPSGSRGYARARGPGWTNAHAKRVALKARNVRRHRASKR